MRVLFLAGLLVASLFSTARAVENVATSSYNTSPPADTDIPNWNSGWTQPTVQPTGYTYTTGWNYLGYMGGNSTIYLGNGWVLAAAHEVEFNGGITVGDVVFNGTTYSPVPGTTRTFGSADVVIFQISPAPELPPLTIRSSNPVAYSSPVVMIGFGHADATRTETWGYNTVTNIGISVPLSNAGFSFTTTDFLTLGNTTTNGHESATNNYQVEQGDSGGPDFIYNNTTQQWELAGMNEVNGTGTYNGDPNWPLSGFVQLNLYASQINPIVAMSGTWDTPTLPQWGLIALAGMLMGIAHFRLRMDGV